MREPKPTDEMTDADLAGVVAGKEGSFARKVGRAVFTSSGFARGSNEPWRTASDPHPVPPPPVIPS